MFVPLGCIQRVDFPTSLRPGCHGFQGYPLHLPSALEAFGREILCIEI